MRQCSDAESTRPAPSMDPGGFVRTPTTTSVPPIFLSFSTATMATEPHRLVHRGFSLSFWRWRSKSLASCYLLPEPRRVESLWHTQCTISLTSRTLRLPLVIFCEHIAALSHFVPMSAAAALILSCMLNAALLGGFCLLSRAVFASPTHWVPLGARWVRYKVCRLLTHLEISAVDAICLPCVSA